MPLNYLSPAPSVSTAAVAVSQPATPLADLDAERSLLAAFLRDPATLPLISRLAPLADFALEDHRRLLAAAHYLAEKQLLISPTTLKLLLEQRRQRTAVALVRSLLEHPPDDSAHIAFDTEANLTSLAQRLRLHANKRQLHDWLEAAPARLRDGITVDAIHGEAEALFAALTHPAPPPFKGWFGGFAPLRQADLNTAAELFPTLRRREVGELLADDAQGKTALLLQLAVSLTAGEARSPLLTEVAAPRRVIYVNDDAAPARLRDELEKLFRQVENQSVAEANFHSLMDGELDGEPINLSAEGLWQRLSAWLSRQSPDLIIFDGVPLPDPDADKPSQRRQQARQLLKRLKELAKKLNCAILVAHSTVTNGNRRRLGNLAFSNADSIYHFRSDHRHRDDYRLFRCVHSDWDLPEPVGLQRNREQGGYEVAPELPEATTGNGKAANPELPTITDLVEFLEDGWQEKTAIVQYFEGQASLSQVERLIKEASLYGWIRRQASTEPWQLDKRGKQFIAERNARAAAAAEPAAAEKNRADAEALAEEEKNSANVAVNCRNEKWQ